MHTAILVIGSLGIWIFWMWLVCIRKVSGLHGFLIAVGLFLLLAVIASPFMSDSDRAEEREETQRHLEEQRGIEAEKLLESSRNGDAEKASVWADALKKTDDELRKTPESR
jgi:hypothetical protein